MVTDIALQTLKKFKFVKIQVDRHPLFWK